MTEQSHDTNQRAAPPSKTEETTGVVVRIDIPPDHHPAVVQGDGPGATLGRGR